MSVLPIQLKTLDVIYFYSIGDACYIGFCLFRLFIFKGDILWYRLLHVTDVQQVIGLSQASCDTPKQNDRLHSGSNLALTYVGLGLSPGPIPIFF